MPFTMCSLNTEIFPGRAIRARLMRSNYYALIKVLFFVKIVINDE